MGAFVGQHVVQRPDDAVAQQPREQQGRDKRAHPQPGLRGRVRIGNALQPVQMYSVDATAIAPYPAQVHAGHIPAWDSG